MDTTHRRGTMPQSVNPNTTANTTAFRPDVEGLRGIAILAVVGYHCGLSWISGGFVGVDVFFVLSGYLITRLLVAEIEATGRLNLLQFYARRVRRLLPASALMLAVTLGVGSLLFAPGELEFAARAARAAAIYLANVFFATNAADYFAPRVELNPLLHMWSLAVEEQFYVFWPLLIAAGLLWVRSRRVLAGALAAITGASLAACIWLTAQDATTAFYLLPTRAWEFGAGGMLSLAVWQRVSPRVAIAIGWMGLLLVGGSLVLITEALPFPGSLAMVPVAGTCCLLFAGATTPGSGAPRMLTTAPLLWVGGLSYSWYLWHWPFLVFTQVLFPEVSLTGKLAAALLALGAAAVSYRFVENPIRQHPALVRRPVLSLSTGVALTVVCFAGAVQTRDVATVLAQTPAMKRFAVAAADDGRVPRAACVSTGAQSAVMRCAFGARDAATHVVLFGDSHAIHWFNPIQSIAEKRAWALTTVLKSGCGAADLDDGTDAPDRAASACETWRREAIDSIVQWRPDLVILGTATNYTTVDRGQWRRRVRDGLRASLQDLVDNGLRVVVMRDVPRFVFDVPDCLARAVRLGWSARNWCRGSPASNVNADVFAAEQDAARGLKGVSFVDTIPALCGGDVCETVSDGRVMYRDDNHLTGAFADTLQPVIEPQLAAALGASGALDVSPAPAARADR
jgi:peptidoglycan/LPS O-acetylase OafA/YrhL